MDVGTQLLIAAIAAVIVGGLSTATTIYLWPHVMVGLVVMGPVCLVWGIAMIGYAICARKFLR